MIANANASPYADERRCKARMELYVSETSEPIVFENEKIKSFSLISEYQAEQTSQPHGELSIVVIDDTNLIDVTNKESLYHQLNEGSCCKLYVSTVQNNNADSYVLAAKNYFRDVASENEIATLNFTDLFGTTRLSNIDMIRVSNQLGKPYSAPTSAYINAMFELLGINNKCVISEELDSLHDFLRESCTGEDGYPISVPDGIKLMTLFLTRKSKTTVRAAFTNNGDLRFFTVDDNPAETITKHKIISANVEPPQTKGKSLVLNVRDRGNVLREPGDRIIVQLNNTYDAEMYMLKHEFDMGTLEGQMKGLIKQ